MQDEQTITLVWVYVYRETQPGEPAVKLSDRTGKPLTVKSKAVVPHPSYYIHYLLYAAN